MSLYTEEKWFFVFAWKWFLPRWNQSQHFEAELKFATTQLANQTDFERKKKRERFGQFEKMNVWRHEGKVLVASFWGVVLLLLALIRPSNRRILSILWGSLHEEGRLPHFTSLARQPKPFGWLIVPVPFTLNTHQNWFGSDQSRLPLGMISSTHLQFVGYACILNLFQE